MRSIPSGWCCPTVLLLGLCFAGCAHTTYSPYGPGYGSGYGYGPSYGPSYMAPQYLGPGTGPTYVPQSTPSSGSPTPITSPPANNSNPLNLRTPSNPPPTNDAPLFNPNPPGGTVPPGRDALDDLNNANPGASLPQENSNVAKLPVYERGGLAAAAPPVVAEVQTVSGNKEDPFFEAPSRLPAELDASPMGTSEPDRSPYQYDGQAYKWLQGAVDYDDKTQTWSIIYDLTPDPTDKYGGSFVITPHPDLGNFQIGDIALLEGTIDTTQKDPSGRLIYDVKKVTGPLTPPAVKK